MNSLSVGQRVTITANETTGDPRWLTAQYGTGCLGGSLIRNGQLDFEDDIAAPRSAVGIKADGSIIFYTIDGRDVYKRQVYNKSRNSVYQSVLPLYYNTTYTVDEMIGVVVTYSASGAAIALAELLGNGSEAAFVERMNKKAGEMGLEAYYRDSCGIADNEISPISMAILARNIIRDYPDILKRTAKKSVYFHGNTYNTTNHLLDTYYYSCLLYTSRCV